MTRPTSPFPPPFRSATARTARSTLVAASTVAILAGAALLGPAAASAAPAAPVVTRAALDPALVAGRGADVAFLEQEAENAATNGTVIGPTATAYTLPAEASGRTRGPARRPGQYVEFTLPSGRQRDHRAVQHPGRARPAAASPRRSTSRVNGGAKQTHDADLASTPGCTTSTRSRNDPNAGLLHPDWWITECGCVPASRRRLRRSRKPFRPMHFYDEQRLLLGKTYQAGDKRPAHRAGRHATPRGRSSTCSTPSWSAPPHVAASSPSNVLLFGADPTGRRDSADAFDQAIAFAQRTRTSRCTSRRAPTR